MYGTIYYIINIQKKRDREDEEAIDIYHDPALSTKYAEERLFI